MKCVCVRVCEIHHNSKERKNMCYVFLFYIKASGGLYRECLRMSLKRCLRMASTSWTWSYFLEALGMELFFFQNAFLLTRFPNSLSMSAFPERKLWCISPGEIPDPLWVRAVGAKSQESAFFVGSPAVEPVLLSRPPTASCWPHLEQSHRPVHLRDRTGGREDVSLPLLPKLSCVAGPSVCNKVMQEGQWTRLRKYTRSEALRRQVSSGPRPQNQAPFNFFTH